jgi:hypothetical protein
MSAREIAATLTEPTALDALRSGDDDMMIAACRFFEDVEDLSADAATALRTAQSFGNTYVRKSADYALVNR